MKLERIYPKKQKEVAKKRGWLNANKRMELSKIPLRRATLINTCLVENTPPLRTCTATCTYLPAALSPRKMSHQSTVSAEKL
jgi:hypothetical protein